MIITRFPPSPTGFLHIGSLRTALFNYLYAKKHGGKFVLRIEDTDRERLVEGGVENIIKTLEWAGLHPDEGPYVTQEGNIEERGEAGPYVQSQRLEIYQKHMEELLNAGHAYPCFCTKERLDELREMQQLNKQATGYDGLCRSLSAEEVEEKKAEGLPYVIRLKVPKDGSTTFTDLIRGDITIKNSEIDEQVLMKSDGYPTYHFAVVVDDHLMGVTHISRGEEWIPSTPKHALLYTLFGWDVPVFAHQTLLVNEQKQKLSKRHGDVSVTDFREKGYLVEALINFVAFLGWNPGDERELFTLEELVDAFSFEQMAKSSAVFNREKLDWYNKQYLMSLPLEDITKRALPFFVKAGFVSADVESDETEFAWLMQVVDLERSRVSTLGELPTALGFVFTDELVYDASMLVWRKSTAEDAKEKLQGLHVLLSSVDDASWNNEIITSTIKDWIQENEFGNGDVLWPLRVALSGQKNSPGPFDIAPVLGKEKSLIRIEKAVDVLA